MSTGDSRYAPELQAALDQYRAARSPEAGVSERVWERVEASVEVPLEGSGTEAPPAPVGTAGVGPKALVLAGVLVMGGALWLLGSEDGQLPAATPSNAVAAPTRAVEAPVAAVAPATAVVEPAAPRVQASSAPEPTSKVSPSPKQRTKAATAPPASTLSAELKLMTAAQDALDAGRARRALRLLQRHRERFAAGALAEEREAAQVEVLCRLGRAAAARRAAARFGTRFPGSPRIGRLTEHCEEAAR